MCTITNIFWGSCASCLRSLQPNIHCIPWAKYTNPWPSAGDLTWVPFVYGPCDVIYVALILGVSEMMFLEEIRIEFINWVKGYAVINVCGHHPILWGPDRPRLHIFSLFLFLPMNIAASGSWDLRCQDLPRSPESQAFSLELHHQLPQFSALSLGLSNIPDFACSLAYRKQSVGLHLLMVWTHFPNVQKNLDHQPFNWLSSLSTWLSSLSTAQIHLLMEILL